MIYTTPLAVVRLDSANKEVPYLSIYKLGAINTWPQMNTGVQYSKESK